MTTPKPKSIPVTDNMNTFSYILSQPGVFDRVTRPDNDIAKKLALCSPRLCALVRTALLPRSLARASRQKSRMCNYSQALLVYSQEKLIFLLCDALGTSLIAPMRDEWDQYKKDMDITAKSRDVN